MGRIIPRPNAWKGVGGLFGRLRQFVRISRGDNQPEVEEFLQHRAIAGPAEKPLDEPRVNHLGQYAPESTVGFNGTNPTGWDKFNFTNTAKNIGEWNDVPTLGHFGAITLNIGFTDTLFPIPLKPGQDYTFEGKFRWTGSDPGEQADQTSILFRVAEWVSGASATYDQTVALEINEDLNEWKTFSIPFTAVGYEFAQRFNGILVQRLDDNSGSTVTLEFANMGIYEA